jgi:hypothetical protein
MKRLSFDSLGYKVISPVADLEVDWIYQGTHSSQRAVKERMTLTHNNTDLHTVLCS